MKKITKKIISIFLSILILLSIPLSVFAESTVALNLDIAQTSFYKGVTCEITAKITNLPESQLLEQNTSAFNWNISGVSSIVSSNNYYYIKNIGENTYTVSETAKFTISDEVGSNIVVSSQYGDSDIYSEKTMKVLQPITNIVLESEQTEASHYVASTDGTDDKLYIDADAEVEFNVKSYPLVNDDRYILSATKACTISNKTEDSFVFKPGTSKKPADFVFDLKVSPESGYKYQKNIKVTKCVPLTKFSLNAGGEEIPSYNTSESEPEYHYLGFIQDESYVLKPKKVTPSYSNDTFAYSLYSYSNGLLSYSPELDKYITIDSNYNCTLNIHNPGTYCLVTENKSAGDGSLNRNLAVITIITVTESNPATKITSINSDVDLYLNAGKDSYNFADDIIVEPIGHTDNIYYLTDDSSIAKVDKNTGLITAVSSGQTKIYAISEKNPSIVAVANVNVFVGISSIANIQKEYSTLPAGHSEQLYPVTIPEKHDETIRWTSLNPEVLSVDQNGYITANPDYDFSDKENVIVGVTATSQFGKTYTTYIQVVPAIEAEKIDISLEGIDVEKVAESKYSCYTGSTFKLSANATGISGNKSNDALVWKVASTSGSFVEIENAQDIFSSVVKNSDGSYTITPKISDTLTFYCYAIKSGEEITNESKYVTVGLKVCSKTNKITVINPADNKAVNTISVSANTTVPLKVSMAPVSSYTDDPFECFSSNEEICKVEKTSFQDFNLIVGDVFGTVIITLKSKSNSKSVTLKVTVNGNLASVEIADLEKEYVYTGSKIEPKPTITYNGKLLFNEVDYSISYSDQTNVGLATMIITGKGEYSGSSVVRYYSIVPKNLGNGKPSENITCSVSGKYSVSTTNKPVAKLAIKYGSITLKEGVDYQLKCTNNEKAGLADAKVVGMGNYTGTFTVKYNISDTLVNTEISPIPSQVYDGKTKTPKVKVKYKGTTLKENVDYKVTYSNNINVGFATVKITGMNNFTSTVSTQFKIIPRKINNFRSTYSSSNSITLRWNEENAYNVTAYQIIDASSNKVIATITDKNAKSYKVENLSYAKRYSFKIRAYLTVKNTKIYGVKSETISVYTKPAKVTIERVTSGKKSLKVNWKALNSRVTGYQVQISTKNNFSSSKIYYVSDYKTATKTISKLLSNKKYYVRVRAYKDIKSGNKLSRLYGSWSKVASVTTKK